MHHKSSQSSRTLSVFAAILIFLFCAVAGLAQEKVQNLEPSRQPQASVTVADPAAGKSDLPSADSALRKPTAEIPVSTSTPAKKSNESLVDGSSDYKKTLN